MIIHVGSTNKTKIDAVKNIFAQSKLYGDADVIGCDAEVEEFGHPKTLEETIAGAKHRALKVFDGAKLSVGIESGMLLSTEAKTGYLETTACAIYDGTDFYIGLGPAFEWPRKVIELIQAGKDGSQAFKEAGLTTHDKIGASKGGIHILTHGKIDRTKLNELAVTMALLQLENPHLYARD